MGKFKIGDRVHYDDRLTKGVGTIHLRAPENEGFDWGVAVAEHDRMRGYHKGNIRWFLARDLRPTLTIEPGRHYRTRSGKPTGRVTVGDTGFEAVVDGKVRIFDKAGGAVHGDDDIVEAWVPKVGERVVVVKTDNFHPAVSSETVCVVDGVTGNAIRLDASTESAGVLHQLAYLSDLEPLPVAPQPAAPSLTGSPVAPTPVAAQVDTLAEEYGPARVATTSDDDDIVEMSIGELTMAIAEALRVVGKKTAKKPVKIGDAVTLSAPARIAGIDKKNAMVVLETGGSFALPLAALRAA